MKAPLGKRRCLFVGKKTDTGEPVTRAYPLLRGFHRQERKS